MSPCHHVIMSSFPAPRDGLGHKQILACRASASVCGLYWGRAQLTLCCSVHHVGAGDARGASARLPPWHLHLGREHLQCS